MSQPAPGAATTSKPLLSALFGAVRPNWLKLLLAQLSTSAPAWMLFVSLIVAALATMVSVYASLASCGAFLRSRSMSLDTSLLVGLRCLGALLLGLVLYLVGAIGVVLVSAVFPGSLAAIVGTVLYAVLSVGFLAWSLTLVAYATSRDR